MYTNIHNHCERHDHYYIQVQAVNYLKHALLLTIFRIAFFSNSLVRMNLFLAKLKCTVRQNLSYILSCVAFLYSWHAEKFALFNSIASGFVKAYMVSCFLLQHTPQSPNTTGNSAFALNMY